MFLDNNSLPIFSTLSFTDSFIFRLNNITKPFLETSKEAISIIFLLLFPFSIQPSYSLRYSVYGHLGEVAAVKRCSRKCSGAEGGSFRKSCMQKNLLMHVSAHTSLLMWVSLYAAVSLWEWFWAARHFYLLCKIKIHVEVLRTAED